MLTKFLRLLTKWRAKTKDTPPILLCQALAVLICRQVYFARLFTPGLPPTNIVKLTFEMYLMQQRKSPRAQPNFWQQKASEAKGAKLLSRSRPLTLGKHFQKTVLRAELVPDSPTVGIQSSSGTAGIFLQRMTWCHRWESYLENSKHRNNVTLITGGLITCICWFLIAVCKKERNKSQATTIAKWTP